MKKKVISTTSIQVLTGLALVVGISAGAQAGLIVETEIQFFDVFAAPFEFTQDPEEGSASFSNDDELRFALFDTLGGTRELTGVEMILNTDDDDAVIALGIGVTAASEEDGVEISGIITADFGVNVNLSNVVSNLFTGSFFDDSATCTTEFNLSCDAFGGDTQEFDEFFDSFTLGDFEIDGIGFFDVNFSILGDAIYNTDARGGIVETAGFFEVSADWRGDFIVNFIYQDVIIVSEPGSLVLFGIGLAGIGWSRRKKSVNQHLMN